MSETPGEVGPDVERPCPWRRTPPWPLARRTTARRARGHGRGTLDSAVVRDAPPAAAPREARHQALRSRRPLDGQRARLDQADPVARSAVERQRAALARPTQACRLRGAYRSPRHARGAGRRRVHDDATTIGSTWRAGPRVRRGRAAGERVAHRPLLRHQYADRMATPLAGRASVAAFVAAGGGAARDLEGGPRQRPVAVHALDGKRPGFGGREGDARRPGAAPGRPHGRVRLRDTRAGRASPTSDLSRGAFDRKRGALPGRAVAGHRARRSGADAGGLRARDRTASGTGVAAPSGLLATVRAGA